MISLMGWFGSVRFIFFFSGIIRFVREFCFLLTLSVSNTHKAVRSLVRTDRLPFHASKSFFS